MGGQKRLVVEGRQLPDSPQVVVAREHDHLVARVVREPGKERQAVQRGSVAVLRLSPVEVISHRDEHHLGLQQPVVPKQSVAVEDAEHPVERGLRVPHRGANAPDATVGLGLHARRRCEVSGGPARLCDTIHRTKIPARGGWTASHGRRVRADFSPGCP